MLVINLNLRIEVDLVTELLYSPVVINIFTTKECLIELTNALNHLPFVRNIDGRKCPHISRLCPIRERNQIRGFFNQRIGVASDHQPTNSARLRMLLMRFFHKRYQIWNPSGFLFGLAMMSPLEWGNPALR